MTDVWDSVFNIYGSCNRCGLRDHRHKIVLGSGSLPATILIVGEAPGLSENAAGLPFVGKSGKILHHAMNRAYIRMKMRARYRTAITNIVACRPCDSKTGDNRQPTKEEAWACWDRLSFILTLAGPDVVVLLGDVARTYFKQSGYRTFHLMHPAYILRRGGLESSEYVRFVRDWMGILEELRDGRK